MPFFKYLSRYPALLAIAFLVTIAVYWPGLYGAYLFDDYPNIVDNPGVQPHDARVSSLVQAALSSPSSEFKRPLASLSFAANYLATGLDPYWMKLTNLVIHLINGWLVFLLSRALIIALPTASDPSQSDWCRASRTAIWIAAGWMLLPINLTAVLYVVQRMESMANAIVLIGLLGYVAGRRRMLGLELHPASNSIGNRGLALCVVSIAGATLVGVLAKETAVMLPLYALLVEWTLFQFRSSQHYNLPSNYPAELPNHFSVEPAKNPLKRDTRVIYMFVILLLVPMLIGLTWLVTRLLKSETWSMRDYTLGTRLLSEARIVADYIAWTIAPTPDSLSFYHDDFAISHGLLSPWTTLASILILGSLVASIFWLRFRRPLAALGIALFFGSNLLTGTIVPLELIFEHRNYFASFGLLLALIPILAAPIRLPKVRERELFGNDALPLGLPRYTLLAGLLICWTTLTSFTAYAWGNPMRLAEDLASRAPESARAQYELGRTYIIYSNYNPESPFTKLAYPPLERAAALPYGSILPEQAMIFMNARMHLPLKDAWWNSLVDKLRARKSTVQDESSLSSLTKCAISRECDLPKNRMTEAFLAALSHPRPSARLLATYGDFAWNVLGDKALGERMTVDAIGVEPGEPAYRITIVRMLVAQGKLPEARQALQQLAKLNLGGRLNDDLKGLRAIPGLN